MLVDELSSIVHISKVQSTGRRMVLKLKEMIPRQMIQIAIQAGVNGKIVARETLKAYRKDVTAKLVGIFLMLGNVYGCWFHYFQYGGDVTRRMKLLAQQAEGKRKMRSVANINLPRETFIDVLKK